MHNREYICLILNSALKRPLDVLIILAPTSCTYSKSEVLISIRLRNINKILNYTLHKDNITEQMSEHLINNYNLFIFLPNSIPRFKRWTYVSIFILSMLCFDNKTPKYFYFKYNVGITSNTTFSSTYRFYRFKYNILENVSFTHTYIFNIHLTFIDTFFLYSARIFFKRFFSDS